MTATAELNAAEESERQVIQGWAQAVTAEGDAA